jgi:hypothetical protein
MAEQRLQHIEAVQGTDGDDNVFGYDHKRKNFIVWGEDIATGKVVIVRVEHDEKADGHGSLDATRRDAARVAAKQNRMFGSGLLATIRMATRK